MGSKRWWVLLVAALFASPALAERIGIAAIVNDAVITTGDVADRRALIAAINQLEVTPETQGKLDRRILQILIDEQLEIQEANRQSQIVTDEDVAKALDSMSAARDGKPGSLKALVEAKRLPLHSLEGQVRAQLAWQRVVQKKLRRNVSISEDEVQRARLAQAAAPGTLQLHIAALSVPVASAKEESAATKVANAIAQQLKTGADISEIALEYGPKRVIFNPPTWVPEESLQPALQQALRAMQPGGVTPPLRSGKSYQIIKLMDRQTIKQQPDSTEVAIKQIAIPVPAQRDKASLAKLEATVSALRSNPGSCTDTSLPATPVPAEVKFARTKFGLLNPQQRAVLATLDVGGVTDPLLTPEVVQLVMLCEKIEPPNGNLPDADRVRQQLYSEKLDLEAQKALRNLRRDAFIDIKDDEPAAQ